MDNPNFVDEEDIPLINQDEDYDDYKTPDTSRIDETSFTLTDTTKATSTLRLRQKLKRHKIVSLYIQILRCDRRSRSCKLRPICSEEKFKKTGNIELIFLNGDKHWQSLTDKRTGELLAPKTLREKFDGVNTMKNILGLDEVPPALERSLKTATKLKSELPTDLQMEGIPLKELSSLVEEIHVKTGEASQQTSLDMREFLGIDKGLQRIQDELLNNTFKLTEIDKRIKRETKKLKEVKNNPGYTDEQRQLYRDRLDNLNTEKQARLEKLPQNWKDLQTQATRIKQTIEKVLDQNTSLGERIRTLFCGQSITIFTILTALSMIISTIVHAIQVFLEGAEGQKFLHQKIKGS